MECESVLFCQACLVKWRTSFRSSPVRVVFTGGPGVGKTSILTQLKRLNFSVSSEIFTEVFTQANFENRFEALFENPEKLLHDLILRQREIERMAKEKIVFFDRGMIDIQRFARNLNVKLSVEDQSIIDSTKYDLAVIVEPLPKEFYDQNQVRRQSFEQAQLDHKYLNDEYKAVFLEASILVVPYLQCSAGGSLLEQNIAHSVCRRTQVILKRLLR